MQSLAWFKIVIIARSYEISAANVCTSYFQLVFTIAAIKIVQLHVSSITSVAALTAVAAVITDRYYPNSKLLLTTSVFKNDFWWSFKKTAG